MFQRSGHGFAGAAPSSGESGWFRYANIKTEAAIFLLVLITFAAVLGKSAITTQTIALTPQSSQYAGYVFSDAQGGGRSVATADPLRSMAWSCQIHEGEYPFCGYGMQFNVGRRDQGIDLSRIQTITLRFSYHGPGERLKLVMKTPLPPELRGKTKDEPLPATVEFPVVQGRNQVRLPLSLLAPEQWWVDSHGLSKQQANPDFHDVSALDITTSDARPGDELAIVVDDITLSGAYLSTEQWYLVILGVWLMLTGLFLVYRFLRMRSGYEARQRRQAEEAQVLADARAAAEAASHAKSQFLGNMSHELRTPLNAVIGYAYWLSRSALDPKQREAVKTIQSSGEHLLAVISDILDIAKIEAGKLELVSADFDLHECAAEIGRMFQLKAEEKGLGFSVSVAPDAPQVIRTDQKRLQQVLINLLGNAVKFTAEGEVKLAVSAEDAGEGAARLRFVVEDTGVGIPADQQEAIFLAFEQAGEAVDRSGGTGLGLSITRQIVELMGGRVQVDSAPGRGSRFTVEAVFPVVAPGEAGAKPAIGGLGKGRIGRLPVQSA